MLIHAIDLRRSNIPLPWSHNNISFQTWRNLENTMHAVVFALIVRETASELSIRVGGAEGVGWG
jgi:hypothetical protein